MTGTAQIELRGTTPARNCHRRLFLVLFLCCAPATTQTIPFEFRNYPDSPIAILNFITGTFRSGSDRRLFLTVKSQSGKGTAAIAFQQTISNGAKIEIVTLERISIIMGPGEKKRLSVSVGDVWSRILTAGASPGTVGKPVLSVVTVEFLDGTLWNAPRDRAPD